jgi:hypothetical protein
MPAICPFCARENASDALVCSSCSRDIAAPASLIAERDDLARKRDMVREELMRVRGELDALKRNQKRRSV